METSPGPNQKKDGVASDDELPESIPFQLGTSLTLRSVTDPALKSQTTVVGVINNIAILVEDPVFTGEHIGGRVGGEIVCAYFLDGILYKFKSRFGQILIHNVVCIDFPKHFEIRRLRQYRRVKVNLEAVSVIGEEGRLINGDIKDVSEGGVCLELPGILQLAPGMPVSLTFVLPNDEQVEDLGCTIMNLHLVSEEKKTITGLSFTGPGSEIGKVTRFCEMCNYFRV